MEGIAEFGKISVPHIGLCWFGAEHGKCCGRCLAFPHDSLGSQIRRPPRALLLPHIHWSAHMHVQLVGRRPSGIAFFFPLKQCVPTTMAVHYRGSRGQGRRIQREHRPVGMLQLGLHQTHVSSMDQAAFGSTTPDEDRSRGCWKSNSVPKPFCY